MTVIVLPLTEMKLSDDVLSDVAKLRKETVSFLMSVCMCAWTPLEGF
jgi:hypothetical protein